MRFAVAQTKHRSLSGYVTEGRASAFETTEPGFRGLLASTNVRELNEKQWEFFRYMVFEVIHSKLASSAILEVLNSQEHTELAALYRSRLPDVLTDIEILRNRYFEAAFRTATNTPEFKRQIDLLKMKAETEGKTEDQVKALVEQEVAKQKAAVLEVSKGHLKASLGRLDGRKQVLRRLIPPNAETGAGDDAEPNAEDLVNSEGVEPIGDELDVALVAEDLLSDPEPAPATDDIHKTAKPED